MIRVYLSIIMLAMSQMCMAVNIDSLLTVLDVVIDDSDNYERIKTERIEKISGWIQNPTLNFEAMYELNNQMYNEYESYVCDSAWKYIDKNIMIAQITGNDEWRYESIIRKAHILATGGLFTESEELLRRESAVALQTNDMRALYYKCLSDAYLYQAENNDANEYAHIYNALSRQYSDSALIYAQQNSYLWLITLAPELVKRGDIDKAKELILSAIDDYADNSHERAVLYSLMSFAYYCQADSVHRMEYLVRSAISDVVSVVKETKALREVSELLYENGDLERANRYLKKSLADANKFNSKLRNIQSAKMLPVIDAAYQKQKEQQQSELKRYMYIISLLSLMVSVALVFIYSQMRKLSRVNNKLNNLNVQLRELNDELVSMNSEMKRTNSKLQESNHIKEEYVGRFMELCTIYISEFDSFRKKLHKASGTTKISDLQRMLSSDESVELILKEFYKTFDKSFLNLFPHFIEQVNDLFPEGAKIVLKQGEKFNTEVRILSLIRLGITDSEKIASFLRCSITTIYTYRSKMKNRSISPDSFEDRVAAIGSELS